MDGKHLLALPLVVVLSGCAGCLNLLSLPDAGDPAYDAVVDRAMMARMDAVVAAEPGLAFALPFDLNAYAPAHNSSVTKAITGDPAADLAGNRTKRFFLDSPALTRASRMELGTQLPGESPFPDEESTGPLVRHQ